MSTFHHRPRGSRRVLVALTAALVGLLGVAVGVASASSSSSPTCAVDFKVLNKWRSGFQGSIEITNLGDAVDGWTLQFDMPEGQQIRHGWIGKFSQSGSTVTVKHRRWNRSLEPGESVNPGFIGRHRGGEGVPTSFTLNGQTCTTGDVPPTTVAPTTTLEDTTTTEAPTTTGQDTTTSTEGTTTSTGGTTPTSPPTSPTTATTTTTTEAPTPTTEPTTSTTSGHDPDKPSAEANKKLIRDNPTRNTQYDNNKYRDVPMDQIPLDGLTVNGDIYNEGLLNTANSGYFRVKCEISHFAYDDPIVAPDKPGAAHLHMFFGNTETNAYSTFDSLMNSGTGTCNGEDLNRTAYWVPAMLDRDGNALIPFEVMVYYKNDNFRLNGANELVEPFPDNLRMISGNGGATAPQNTRSGGSGGHPIISFHCSSPYSGGQRYATIPDCTGTGGQYWPGRALEMQIVFPQCFNPADGTYLSDQSHMSYSEGGYYGAKCPASHPHDVSSIMYRIFFNPDEYGGTLSGLHLSSDVKHDGRILPGGTTAHADWFGAWHPDAMRMWVDNCNNTQADCEIGLLDRDPAISMVKRKEGFYPKGYLAKAEDLIKLCPGKTLDPNDRLRSVANCRHQ